ncbi:MAG: hypothetical protein ACAI44_39715 [Candidatus Sericytochromatia bacterium]
MESIITYLAALAIGTAPAALVLFKKIQNRWINTLLFLAVLTLLTGAVVTLVS